MVLCRMALLLGPPSSGKTTLLLALAGKLDPELKVDIRLIPHHFTEKFVLYMDSYLAFLSKGVIIMMHKI